MWLLQRQKELGNKWSEIARDCGSRTEIQVKNRFKSLVKKAEDYFKSNNRSKAGPSTKDIVHMLIQKLEKQIQMFLPQEDQTSHNHR